MPRLKLDDKSSPVLLISRESMSVNKTGSWRSIRPEIEMEKCAKCMICWKFCPEVCVAIDSGEPVIDMSYCKGCAICVEVCPTHCITMVDEEGG